MYPKTCIFCKKEFEDSDPEHFFPQVIGGKETINCVCNLCNHTLGSRVDARIRKNSLLSNIIDKTISKRTWEIVTKDGKTEKRKIEVTDTSADLKKSLKFDNRSASGPLQIQNFKLTVVPDESLRLYKVYAKTLLGYIAFAFGAEEALKPQYDCLRAFVTSDSEQIPGDIEIHQAAPIVFAQYKKIEVKWDREYDEVKGQVTCKSYTFNICNPDKGFLYNLVSVANDSDNGTFVGVVVFLNRTAGVCFIRNCQVPERKAYLF